MVETGQNPAAPSPLLETKLFAPRWRSGLVSRPRLIERLGQSAYRKLTLVSAPAGFGKTTLLAEWLAAAESEKKVAWVSLDAGDNDPALFWSYFIAAIRKILPGVGESSLASLRSPQPGSINSTLATLINEVSAVTQDFTIVLDDFHVIESRPVHEAVAYLVEHMPPQMHIVMTGRADPPLPLSRIRVRGELLEVRSTDLRFTPDEAAAFLNDAMGLRLSAEDVAALETRTEGWIAGLQLAALSMQGRADTQGFIKAFAGDDRYVVDYLVEEVLQLQPEDIRTFLLQTSVLDRLTGPLCDAVTGRSDSGELLESLERDNLFVVPLDDKRQWYRYHHLFADVLRAHAMEERPGDAQALRKRAADWYEANGMAPEAIEQARSAGDHEAVARLVVANFDEFERSGHYASLSSWASSLPEEMLKARPRLALMYSISAWRSESRNRTSRKLAAWAEAAIKEIEARGGLDPSDDIDGTVVGPEGLEALKGEELVLRLFHSSREMSFQQMSDNAAKALELIPENRSYIRGMLHMMYAGVRGDLEGMEAAIPVLDSGAEEARRSENLPLLISFVEHRGNVSFEMGRLDEARDAYEETLRACERVSPESRWMGCGPHAGLANLALERGDLDAAAEHVEKALTLVERGPVRGHILFARRAAINLSLVKGDFNSAYEQLAKIEEFARGGSDTRHVAFISSVRLDVFVSAGDIDAAEAAVNVRGLTPDVEITGRDTSEIISYSRYLLARGDYKGVIRVIPGFLPGLRESGRVKDELRALATLAAAHELLGERALAMEALGRSTALGEPGGFNRLITGAGPVMTGLLEALVAALRRGRGPAECGSLSYLSHLLGGDREISRSGGVVSPSPAVPEAVDRSTQPMAPLADPLSERELEVLAMIASGASNQQIAERLVVSMSTVKTHINRTYRKLGARSRTQAVAMGRQLGLL